MSTANSNNNNRTLLLCFNYTYYPAGSLTNIVSCYVFPVICFVGIIGAVLNLFVLNSKGMKTKTNCFLSAMSFVDMCFFVVMFVINLYNYERLFKSESFNEFYYASKMLFTALANCFSSSSLWFAFMLTVERLIAIRKPLHAHLFWRKYQPNCIIGAICFVSFLLQIYNFFWLSPISLPNCGDEKQRVYVLKQIRLADNYYVFYFVQYSLIVIPLITITLPVVLLALFNCLLLYYLRLSRRELRGFVETKSLANHKEWKVTVTVLAIVFTLIFFNMPSVIYYWLSTYNIVRSSKLSFFSNLIIVVSKALNFFLYCITSSHFRLCLLKMFVSSAKIRHYTFHPYSEYGVWKLLNNKRMSSKNHETLKLTKLNTRNKGVVNYVHSSDIDL